MYRDDGEPKYPRLGIESGERAVRVVTRADGSVRNLEKGTIYYTLGCCLADLAEEDDDEVLKERAVRAGETAR